MDYKIKSTYEVTQTHEFSVDWNGFNFLIIYGRKRLVYRRSKLEQMHRGRRAVRRRI